MGRGPEAAVVQPVAGRGAVHGGRGGGLTAARHSPGPGVIVLEGCCVCRRRAGGRSTLGAVVRAEGRKVRQSSL